jgi:DNA-binding NarL/FixJ family response regulator
MISRTLLLVEDERDSRESLTRALTRAGYLCHPAATEAEALDLAARHPLDAAVLDVRLGDDEHAGLKLVRALRGGASRVPVILITAFADLDKVKQALNDGASFLLEKPFKAPELLAVLARVLSEADSTGHLIERALARAHLTEREVTVARLLLKGLPSAEIATLLANSDKTVRQHISQIYAKCGVNSRAEFFHHIFPS